MAKFLFTLMLVFLSTTIGKAQISISGIVTDSEQKPAEAVIITAMQQSDSTIIGYSMTNELGMYQIILDSELPNILLRMTGFNVKTAWQTVENKNQELNWEATNETLMLKEVQIMAQKIWGKDTLNYLVASYLQSHDRTIGDVLRRLPGIDIKGNGTITYQGIPINRFYIENMDVLQGMYNMATDGIKATDIATVQVLEHHEHIKALQDQTPAESAAINLKLKKDKKGIWNNAIHLGGGYEKSRLLWNNDVNLSFFGKKAQHVLYYGNSNVGQGSDAGEVHYGGNSITAHTLSSILDAGTPSVGVSGHNDFHEVYLKNLRKLNDSTEFHYDLNYSHAIMSNESYSRTTYLMPDGNSQVLDENIYCRHTKNDLSLNLTYELNAQKEYITNSFDLAGIWDNGSGSVLTSKEVKQLLFNRTLGIHDYLKWVHRTSNGKGFELSTNNTFKTNPQHLSVQPGMFANLFTEGEEYNTTLQTARINRFTSYNNFSLLQSIHSHRFTIIPTAYINLEHVNLQSDITADDEVLEGNYHGNMNYTKLNAGAGAKVRYSSMAFNLTVDLPLSFAYNWLSNEPIANSEEETSKKRAKGYFNPSTFFTWKMNDNFSLNGNAGYNRSTTSWNSLYTAYMIGNYRSINRYKADMYDTDNITGRLKLNVKDILKEIFAYLELWASRTHSNVVYGSYLDENSISVMEMQDCPNTSTSYGAAGDFRKNFSWMKLGLDIKVNYSRSNNQFLRQSVLTKYSSDSYGVQGSINIQPFKRLTININSAYSVYTSKTDEGIKSSNIRNWNNNLTCNFVIIENQFFFSANLKHIYNNSFTDKKNYEMAGAGLRYKFGKTVELSLDASNLFNTNRFISRINSDMTEFYTEYYLRPTSVMISARFNL